MKTIKEIASEIYPYNEDEFSWSTSEKREAFESGAELVQRWIPINETMPEEHQELLLDKKGKELEITKPVLVKYENGRYAIDCRRNAGDSYNFWKIEHYGIIEWRQIERQ